MRKSTDELVNKDHLDCFILRRITNVIDGIGADVHVQPVECFRVSLLYIIGNHKANTTKPNKQRNRIIDGFFYMQKPKKSITNLILPSSTARDSFISFSLKALKSMTASNFSVERNKMSVDLYDT